jgi:hypothetical protein
MIEKQKIMLIGQITINKIIFIIFLSTGSVFSNSILGQITSIPPSIAETAGEPIKYTGDLYANKRFYDGNLPYAVGTHHYQVLRANRNDPSEPGIIGWTYNHQPYLAYWNGKFYLQYLSGLVNQHEPPSRTLIMTSEDGIRWSSPLVVFPQYSLPDIDSEDEIIHAGKGAVMHQRMGFYVAPNGKLLTLGFYGYCATPRRSPNTGNGIGRVVREIYKDGELGPIYFIRYNRHAGWNESNTDFPYYKTSKDKGFMEACESLLTDKLMTFQWWEEDRGTDEFFPIDPSEISVTDRGSAKIIISDNAGKAFNYYRRSDDVIVGIWKHRYSSLSSDNGRTWTPISQNLSLQTAGDKTWGQRTDDGRFVIVYNHSATVRNRFPMTALVGEDGHIFERIYTLSGELAPRRYKGLSKAPGLQYFRGIIEGNGNPPGDYLWMTYSVNREDIWVTRARVPISASVTDEVDEDFEEIRSIQDLELWNIYMPTWAPVSIQSDPATNNNYLQLRDEEPYDYASVTRIFPKDSKKTIEFRFQGERIPQGFAAEIEVHDQKGNRALKLNIDSKWLSFDIERITTDPLEINSLDWNHLVLSIDCINKTYTATLNGELTREDIPFNARNNNDEIERIVFRTGPYRNYVQADMIEFGYPGQSGFYSDDLPGSGIKSPLILFNIDNIITR